jgi:hypothetical protein
MSTALHTSIIDHASAPAAAIAPKSRGWEMNVGPLAVGNRGTKVMPQFLIGGHVGNFSVEAGLHDVRDGIHAIARAGAGISLQATGHSINELHESLQCDTNGIRQALDMSKRSVISSTKMIGKILGMTKEELEGNLQGEDEISQVATPKLRPMSLKVDADVHLGMSVHVCLGWPDKEGYRMVGVGAEIDAGVDVEGKIFAGRHKSKETAKIRIGVANFTFTYIFPIRAIRPPCARCAGTGKKGTTGMSPLCADCNGKGYEKYSAVPVHASKKEGTEDSTDDASRLRSIDKDGEQDAAVDMNQSCGMENADKHDATDDMSTTCDTEEAEAECKKDASDGMSTACDTEETGKQAAADEMSTSCDMEEVEGEGKKVATDDMAQPCGTKKFGETVASKVAQFGLPTPACDTID